MEPKQRTTCAEIEAKIRQCFEQRRRVYSNKCAITIRWEDDDTNAMIDAFHFKDVARILGVDDVHESEISSAFAVPSMYVEWEIACCMKNSFAAQKDGTHLIIIHYAGNGLYEPERGQYFYPTEDSSHRFYLRSLLHPILTFAEIDGPAFDVVLILDSYCSPSITPIVQPKPGQTIELLAPLGYSHDSYPVTVIEPRRSASITNTFTSRIARALTQWELQGFRDMNFATLLGVAQEEEGIYKPIHKFLAGSLPIKIGIPPYDNDLPIDPQESGPEPVPGQIDALITCSIVHDPALGDRDRLTQWIDSLDECMRVYVHYVSERGNNGSPILALRAPFHVACVLESLPGVVLKNRRYTMY
ncbi:hypothetical protein H112_06013 [Trichophyton rubrum D6]|uniref:Uncharacterized protein n=2 Tax=Trichophyton rubrum TaxID=5551 RepID=F2SLP0_TRIRC|nr:uncharacterized protein TERG_03718 [Trichophyton rubrum CBS 118892]EZF14844.1 hypothetical protein H100_06027 [Trichophyton rubrum MR850]EZF39961.1 hypothetical protein H102_05996 [Trichophyton rubrum CBS 100081]EZF50601.1 hypothetical protein H103_06021 [Trichophyton rubrum CBS 288.86]EZF61145.1 hypothetical protein H104_06009 [Trichophyton rubrum CBS 289.86]EZF82361.1 hypothetical protein H110_06017 [Trichophyton rubrum MR1448]EZF93037.1 hypothetical protein H113_06064 [Trichophyton rubr